jgi:hypothetical protein
MPPQATVALHAGHRRNWRWRVRRRLQCYKRSLQRPIRATRSHAHRVTTNRRWRAKVSRLRQCAPRRRGPTNSEPLLAGVRQLPKGNKSVPARRPPQRQRLLFAAISLASVCSVTCPGSRFSHLHLVRFAQLHRPDFDRQLVYLAVECEWHLIIRTHPCASIEANVEGLVGYLQEGD